MSLQKHPDSDSVPSDDEKKVIGVRHGEFETLGHGELLPDPDAGLNEAEKAAIVRTSVQHSSIYKLTVI